MPDKRIFSCPCPSCKTLNSLEVEILRGTENETSIANITCKCTTEYKFQINGKPRHNGNLFRTFNKFL